MNFFSKTPSKFSHRIPALPVYISYGIPKELESLIVDRATRSDPNEVGLVQRRPRGSFGAIMLWCDPYALRTAFERLDGVDSATEFLTTCGPLSRTVSSRQGITWSDLQRWQSFFKDWQIDGYQSKAKVPAIDAWGELHLERLTGQPHWSILPSRQPEKDGPIIGSIQCESAFEAIAATIHLDILAGVRWRRCLECSKAFRVANIRKLYCDHECAHNAGQKARRALKRRESTPPPQDAVHVKATVPPFTGTVLEGSGK